MLRGRIQGVDHCCFHVTHRCQERRFLLKFEIDRRNYTKRLREAAWKYPVDVLDYMVTSNEILSNVVDVGGSFELLGLGV